MPDSFDIRRKLDRSGDDLVEELQEQRQETMELARERIKRLIRLKVGYFFDPVTREILRKVGSQFVYVRHDRRRTQRLSRAEAETGEMRLIQGGLFWDPKGMAVYQFRSGQYVLYSRDRRKDPLGHSPTGKERRKGKA
jgi:hypothetical protein